MDTLVVEPVTARNAGWTPQFRFRGSRLLARRGSPFPLCAESLLLAWLVGWYCRCGRCRNRHGLVIASADRDTMGVKI